MAELRNFTFKQINGYLRASKTVAFNQNVTTAMLHQRLALFTSSTASTDIMTYLPASAHIGTDDTNNGFRWSKVARADLRTAHRNKWLAREALMTLDNEELTKVLNEKTTQ